MISCVRCAKQNPNVRFCLGCGTEIQPKAPGQQTSAPPAPRPRVPAPQAPVPRAPATPGRVEATIPILPPGLSRKLTRLTLCREILDKVVALSKCPADPVVVARELQLLWLEAASNQSHPDFKQWTRTDSFAPWFTKVEVRTSTRGGDVDRGVVVLDAPTAYIHPLEVQFRFGPFAPPDAAQLRPETAASTPLFYEYRWGRVAARFGFARAEERLVSVVLDGCV